jgi:hypothetical protein
MEEKTAYFTENPIICPIIPSARRPVKHDVSQPNPKRPQQRTLQEEEEPTNTSPEDESGPSCSSVDRVPGTNCTSSYIAI